MAIWGSSGGNLGDPSPSSKISAFCETVYGRICVYPLTRSLPRSLLHGMFGRSIRRRGEGIPIKELSWTLPRTGCPCEIHQIGSELGRI